jgi:opacity protein-like surface antigen
MMRWIPALAAVAAVWASSAQAQDKPAPHLNRHYWQHCWAVQFAVSNASLQSFDGATISLRRHFGQGSALRLGLTMGPVVFNEYQYESGSSQRTQESNNQAAGFELEYIGYLGPGTNVSPHLTIGAGTGVTRSEVEDRFYSRSWNVSLVAGFGVEWFVHHRVAVSGEYTAGLTYSDGFEDYYYGGNPPDHAEHQSLQLGGSKVRMGVAVSL